jgi:hypothetical protein
VAPPTSRQLAWRGRIEAALRVAEPGLDLLLLAGDRLSRLVAREELSAPPARRRVTPISGVRRVGPGRAADA